MYATIKATVPAVWLFYDLAFFFLVSRAEEVGAWLRSSRTHSDYKVMVYSWRFFTFELVLGFKMSTMTVTTIVISMERLVARFERLLARQLASLHTAVPQALQ